MPLYRSCKFSLVFLFLSLGAVCSYAQNAAAAKAPAANNNAATPAAAVKAKSTSAPIKTIGNGRGGSYMDEDESGIKKVRKRKQRAKRAEEEEIRQWQLNVYKK